MIHIVNNGVHFVQVEKPMMLFQFQPNLLFGCYKVYVLGKKERLLIWFISFHGKEEVLSQPNIFSAIDPKWPNYVYT